MIGFVINFEGSTGIPKYIQLYEYIKKEIMENNMTEGEKLPSVRSVCETLKISKATVENAYSQLVVEGYIESRSKSGYYVIAFDDFTFTQLSGQEFLPHDQKTLIEGPVKFDRADEGTFNFTEWKKAVNRVLEYDTQTLLSYGDVQGEYALRYEIAKFIHQSRGGRCHPDQIIVGAGIQVLFGLIATLFRGKEDQIGFEYPGFSKGMYIFEDYGYQTVKIPVEADGIDLNRLEASQTKIVYVSPSHQYPTGSIMPIKKRIQLLNWASKKGAYIIEDDYDSMLRYEGYPVPALQGLNYGKNVIYVGSFSKLLIPSLRISFMILPERLMEDFKRIKGRYSQTVSKIEQLALAIYMSEGSFERHIRRIKKIYGRKNQLLIESFKRYPTANFKLIGKESGLHVVLDFHVDVKITKVVTMAKSIGVLLEGVDEYPDNRILVFSYSGIPDDSIDSVVKEIVEISNIAKNT